MAFFICSAVLLVLGVLIGYRIGSELGGRAESTRQYWACNVGIAAACVLAIAVLGLVGLVLFEAVALGVLAGGVAGLKMAFGESAGPWKSHDRYFDVNRSHREAAGGKGAERRARRRRGEAPPDVISVAGDDADARGAEDGRGNA